MAKIISLEQGSSAWLDYRKGKLGASEAAAVLGIDRHCTPYQLWLKKLGLSKEQEENPGMLRGKKLEPDALAKYIVEKGCIFNPIVLESTIDDFMIASLDGMPSSGNTGCEIKCLKLADHDKQEVSPAHYAQIQHQMFVGGFDEIDYVGYHPDSNVKQFYIIPVKRDDAFIKDYLVKAKGFWNYVTTFTEPPKCDRDYIDLSINLDYRACEAAYVDVVDRLEKLKEQQEQLRVKLLDMANGNNVQGAYTKLTNYVSKGRVQYDKIECLHEIDLEQYRGSPIQSTRITRI